MSNSVDPLTKTEGGQTNNQEALLAGARRLVPKLRERAQDMEDARRMLGETERDLHNSGLFRIVQPKRVGGAELDYVALVDFGEIISHGCSSTGWLLTNLACHHWMMAMFPEAAQDEVWTRDENVLIGSSLIFPAGRARCVDGGYKLSGRWAFSSGVDLSKWNMLAGIVEADSDQENREYRIFVVHKDSYETIDTWHAAGLRGTGSNDVTCEEVFVPDHMSLAVDDLKGGDTPGSAVNPAPLYRLPVFALFPFVLSGVALGNAQAVCDDFIESAKTRASRYSGAQISDFQAIHIKIAEASAKVDAARTIMRRICVKATKDAHAGIIPDMAEKLQYRRDGAFSVRLCTEAVDLLFTASGASGLFSRNHIQRAFRDAHAISAHIVFNCDVAGAAFGRAALGFTSDNPTL